LFGAQQGEDYLVMIDGIDGARGSIRLTYSLELAPAAGARIQFGGGTLVIQQPVPPGQYEIAVGQDLSVLTTVLTTNVVGGLLEFTDPDTTPASRRFYRINGMP
jgi:hypothetical protein